MTRSVMTQRAMLALSLVALLASAYAALGPRGDVSIRQDCKGTALSARFSPQVEDPARDAAGFVDAARLCNENAAQRARLSFVLSVFGLTTAAGGVVLTRR